MTENLDRRILDLRQEMQDKYASGDKEAALRLSRRLDSLIALRQRERLLLQDRR